MPISVYPKGTTLYKADQCYNGLTVISLKGEKGADVALINMEGEPVKRWAMSPDNGGVPRARLLPNGNLLILRNRCVEEYDWDGNVVWEYVPPDHLQLHHDVEKTNEGNTLVLTREEVPEEIRSKAKEPERREMLYADVIQEISPDKEVLWEWHQCEHVDIDLCCKVPAPVDWWAGPANNTLVDWTHTNTIQSLPENHWYDSGDERFKPGNVLMSLRQLDLVMIADRDSKEIVWTYTGDYKGGLSGQHDSHMIEKGIPGEGNIIIFDNGSSPTTDLSHCGASFVLEINPSTKETIWVYEDREQFHSNFTSSCQRLPNGNTLILEAAHKRLFEVTPECEIVWEHAFAEPPFIQRSYRYGSGYCPQIDSLL